MDIRLPDGTILRNVPEGTTRAQIEAKLSARGMAMPQQTSPQRQPQQKEGVGRTAFDQTLQGLTFGFGDEIADVLGAAGASALDPDLTYGEAYNQARQLTKERQDRQFDQHPVVSIGGNIAGSLITGGAGVAKTAGTKAGAAALDWLGRGNLATRAVKAGLASAPGAALAGAGTAADGDMAAGAMRGGALGFAGGALVPVAGAGLRRLNTRTNIPNADEIRKRAGELYQAAERSGGVLKPQFTDKFVDTVERMKPQTDIGRIVGGDDAFSKVVDRIGQIRGQPMTLRAAQELDELLGDAIDGFTEMGRVTKQGKKLLDIQSSLRNMIEDAGDDVVVGGKSGFDALKQARSLWSTSHRMNDIERIIQRAEQYDQPATAIKTGFRTLYNNPNKMRGYSAAEKEAIKKAAESGVLTDLLRTAGSRLIPIVAGASGGGVGTTAAAQMGSMASRGAATRTQLGKANKVARAIAENSGLARQESRVNLPQLPNRWREFLLLPPKQGQQAMQQATMGGARAQPLALPAPDPQFSADSMGNVQRLAGEDLIEAMAARQRATELGLTPDVVRAQERNKINQAMQAMGQSDLGQFAAQHPDIPISAYQDLSEGNWQRLMKLPPDQARTELMKLFKSKK